MITSTFQGVQQNLRFLITEVSSQLTSLQEYIAQQTPSLAKQILDRSGYIHNLKSRVHDGCLGLVANPETPIDTNLTRSIETIASELEQIAKLCREAVHQITTTQQPGLLKRKQYLPLLRQIDSGIQQIEHAIEESDTATALAIGNCKQQLDHRYEKLRRYHHRQLKRQRHPEDIINAMFVAHAIEQMGESLVNISEALITAHLGLPLNTPRYQALQSTLEQLHNKPLESLNLYPIAETRSGSGISGIREINSSEDKFVAIYKDGTRRKLKEERQGVESWHEICPGIAPQIIAYHKHGSSASMLIEHLSGATLEQILLHGSRQELQSALKRLTKTLKKIWKETRIEERNSAHHIRQLRKRMEGVYAIHPEFRQRARAINGHPIPSFDTLIELAEEVEARLLPPFSVYIHGDFNLDNIIYDASERRIHFIDLHRSRHTDYVQDISVLMVSCYRLQVFDRPLRQRSMTMAIQLYHFARRYAHKRGDTSFELRMALGLARSFATSTRFILDHTLANNMFLRARYLLERIVELPEGTPPTTIPLPIEELFRG